MRIALTGSSGFLGSALIPALIARGHTVVRMVRRPAGANEARWDPAHGTIDDEALEGIDGVINLAGENIATRWTKAAKRGILQSRVRSTTLIAESMARLRRKPRALLSVSAVGYYGDRGEDPVDETTPPGSGFLAEVAQAWEQACRPAAAAGIRVITPRLGLVLSPEGGALAKMLPVFKLGLGGKFGSGSQWMSWVALDDVIGAMLFALTTDSLSGPFNLVAPEPVRNSQFTHTLARLLSRPALFTVPPIALHLMFGREMAEETLLTGARVAPARLRASGYQFELSQLEPALLKLLGT